ncbi:hypothetical protein [Brevibacillus borstelensis]|uniref:hypothetical protein n=1 Tax=Brevibacillus borstelensis TaxID=45462 RepID=UPI0030BA69FC
MYKDKRSDQQPQINLLIARQNMDTPYITDQELDSDVNEDPKREYMLDESAEAFIQKHVNRSADE